MISNLAYIHPDAKIGENVEIAPFAYIEGDVVIGDGTKILSGAHILNGARIGKNCSIHNSATIAGIPQDLKFAGEYSTAVIGDNTVVRECATINRGSASKGTTIVGSNCLLMTGAHVAHDSILGDNVILANNVSIAGEVIVDDWAILGGHSAVHQFCKVGAHTMVAGGAMVTKDVPPYVMVGRSPVSYHGLNIVGLRRRGFDNDTITSIKDIYNHIYNSEMNVTDACSFINDNINQSEHRDYIVEFVRSSDRGIIP